MISHIMAFTAYLVLTYPPNNDSILFRTDYCLIMKPKSEKSLELYNLMLSRGYPEEFCDAVTKNLNMDFTAKRMLGYLRHIRHPSLEDIADEMLAILSDRAAIMRKKDMEATQIKWNQIMAEGFGEED